MSGHTVQGVFAKSSTRNEEAFINAKMAISTTPFKLFELVMTPYGKGHVQYFLFDKGELQLVVSQSEENIPKGETIRGIWKLRFLEPSQVEKIKKG